MIVAALYVIFIAAVLIQLSYFFLFSKFAFAKGQHSSKNSIQVSVIICARNEAENLSKNLAHLFDQNYKSFEVILVNDASTDNSSKVLDRFKEKYDNLKIITIPSSEGYKGNKKNAITKGVEASTSDYLLFTDADCKPISDKWIARISSHFDNEKEIVLGYGGYRKIKNSFLNKVIRFETLMTAIQYFSYTKAGVPYMGVGRNLAYKKELFVKANGLTNHQHIQSGDDDLFINQIATKSNATISFSKDSFTLSKPKETFISWFKQKRRHITTAIHYKPIHQLFLGVYFLSQLLFWTVAIILLSLSFKWQLVTILITIRLIIQYIILGNAAKKLNEKDLILLFPVLDIVIVTFQLGIYISNLIFKPNNW